MLVAQSGYFNCNAFPCLFGATLLSSLCFMLLVTVPPAYPNGPLWHIQAVRSRTARICMTKAETMHVQHQSHSRCVQLPLCLALGLHAFFMHSGLHQHLLYATHTNTQCPDWLQFDIINYAAPAVCIGFLCTSTQKLQGWGTVPPKRLLTAQTLLPLLLLAVLLPLQQGLAQLALHRQPWYSSTTDQVVPSC